MSLLIGQKPHLFIILCRYNNQSLISTGGYKPLHNSYEKKRFSGNIREEARIFQTNFQVFSIYRTRYFATAAL